MKKVQTVPEEDDNDNDGEVRPAKKRKNGMKKVQTVSEEDDDDNDGDVRLAKKKNGIRKVLIVHEEEEKKNGIRKVLIVPEEDDDNYTAFADKIKKRTRKVQRVSEEYSDDDGEDDEIDDEAIIKKLKESSLISVRVDPEIFVRKLE